MLSEAYTGQVSRVFRRLRDELGLCYYVGAYQLLGLDPGYFTFYVGTTPQNVGTCEKEIFAELEKLEANGLTDEELTRAKNSIIGQRRVHMQDNSELSLLVGTDELCGLATEFQDDDDKYRAVTLDELARGEPVLYQQAARAVVVTPAEEVTWLKFKRHRVQPRTRSVF